MEHDLAGHAAEVILIASIPWSIGMMLWIGISYLMDRRKNKRKNKS